MKHALTCLQRCCAAQRARLNWLRPPKTLHSKLAEAGVEVAFDKAAAADLVSQAERAFSGVKADWQRADPQSAAQVQGALAAARQAVTRGDEPALARA